MMNQNMNQPTIITSQDRAPLSSGKQGNVSNADKNANRMRRKTQEAEDNSLYEIDIDKVDIKSFLIKII